MSLDRGAIMVESIAPQVSDIVVCDLRAMQNCLDRTQTAAH